MDREQAISILKELNPMDNNLSYADCEAIAMAIEALSAESKETE